MPARRQSLEHASCRVVPKHLDMSLDKDQFQLATRFPSLYPAIYCSSLYNLNSCTSAHVYCLMLRAGNLLIYIRSFVSLSCVCTTKPKSTTLKRYALHTSCKFGCNSNSDTVSNKRQELTHNEPLLDQTQAITSEEEAR
jgi:hypothetical protein